MTYILWIAAFLGVAVIYFGEKVYKLITKATLSPEAVTALKALGVVIAAAAMIILYKTGRLI